MQLTVRGSSSSVTAGRQLASTSSSGSARKALMFAARGQQGATTASSTAADDSSKGTITTTTTAALTTASVTTDSAAAASPPASTVSTTATLMKVKAAPLADPLLSESFERFALAESGFGAARPPLAPAASGDAMMHVIPFQQISWYPRITYYPGRSSRSDLSER